MRIHSEAEAAERRFTMECQNDVYVSTGSLYSGAFSAGYVLYAKMAWCASHWRALHAEKADTPYFSKRFYLLWFFTCLDFPFVTTSPTISRGSGSFFLSIVLVQSLL